MYYRSHSLSATRTKRNYIRRDGQEKAKAKAHIRYIQNRPGRTAEHAQHQAQHHHRGFFCCGQFAENCDLLGFSPTLAIALSPDYSRYHSRYCETFTSYYRDAHLRPVEKIPQQDNVLADQPDSGESKAAPAKGNGRERITRTLFGRDGAMDRQAAYQMIDSAEKGSIFFRFVISPDPQTEDTKRDVSLREVTEKTLVSLEERIHKQVQWAAAVHADHTEVRHVHIVAVVAGRLQRQDFQALPQVLRGAATEACMEQRRELDLMQEKRERAQEEAAWERER